MTIYPVTRDSRYVITQEGSKYVLRFNGELIAESISRASLAARAVGHYNAANGAPVIEAIEALEPVYIEPANESGLDRRVFRRMANGALEWAHFSDWESHGTRARFYGFASRDLPESIAAQEASESSISFAQFRASRTPVPWLADVPNLGADGVVNGGFTYADGFWLERTDSHFLVTCENMSEAFPLTDEGLLKAEAFLFAYFFEDTDSPESVYLTAKALELACIFSATLADEIGPDNLQTVIERNKSYDSNVCASHDFCDANMTMLHAWRMVHGVKVMPFFLTDSESERGQADMALWGKAWDIAKANAFFTEGNA